MTFTFPAAVAWDPIGKQAVKNTSFQVYTTADTGFVTPLAITDPFGVTLPGNILNSGSQGVFPQFNQAANSTIVITDPAHIYAWTVNAVMQDASVAAYVGQTGSATALAVKAEVTAGATAGVLNTTYVPKWKSTTAYLAGFAVLSPVGDVVTAKVDFTSGASFDAANWNLSPTYAGKVIGSAGTTSGNAGTILRAGYDAPGNGTNAAFSVNGPLSVANGAADIRLWNNWDYQNSVSVRNTSGVDSDSAIRFLDGSAGLERGAIGFHNGGANPNSAFYASTFIESSNFIKLDGSLVAGYTTVPVQPLRFVTTGFTPTWGYGSWGRMGFEANGDTNLYYIGGQFTAAKTAIKIPENASGVVVKPKLLVAVESNTQPVQAELDVRGQVIVGQSTVTRAAEVAKGYDFSVVGPNQTSVQLLRENVGRIAFDMVPGFFRITDTDNNKIISSSSTNGVQGFGLFGMENFGGGTKVLGIGNVGTVPTAAPSGGGALFSHLGALRYMAESGTLSTIGGDVVTKTTDYTALVVDRTILATGGAGGITITLPAAIKGARHEIKKIDSGAGAVTIATTSAQTIDGVTTKSLAAQYDKITAVSDGTAWYIV